jgi:integrase
MPHLRKQLPKYCLHKASKRAFVRIGGKMHYLGEYGSAASRREYDRIIAEFVAHGRQPYHHPDDILIEHLIVRFLDHAEKERHYCDGTAKRITAVLRLLNDLYGKVPALQFNPMALKSVRRQFLESGLSLDTINGYVGVIKQVFYWGCEEEIVPAEIAGALRMVKALQKGRSAAVEYEDILPVADVIVEKTLPYIRSQRVKDMIQVQRYICGRPQDIHNMRLCDIDQSGEVWRYTPYTHKTKYRGKSRDIPIGPKAQKILQPYLDRCKDDPKQFVFPRPKAKGYHSHYANAILVACKKAGVPPWTPNQLRHAGGTEVRDKFGLDYAQAVLGHSSAKITEVYAKASFDKAAKVAKEIG